jgi:ABC-2 type transport system permease protein
MKIFWSFTRQAFHAAAIYRFDFWLRLCSLCLVMYSVHQVWQVLYTQQPGAFGVSLEQMVTYGMLAIALDMILHSSPQWYMAQQVRTGAIDTDLMKPIDFHLYMLARSAGEVLFALGVLSIPPLVVSFALLQMQPPPDAATSLMFGISLVLGFLIRFHLGFLLGSLAFITIDIRHISWAYYSLMWFLGGQLVPLWLFPGWLEAVAQGLPFQGIYFIPASIYIGRFASLSALAALGFQLLWVALLWLASRLVWARVQARLVVQGG